MIFGKSYSYVKIIDTDIEFELLYTGIMPSIENNIMVKNESPFTGKRSYLNLWNLVDFKLRVYLFNHDSPTDYYNQISRLRDTQFYFKEHKFESDGVTPAPYIKDEDNNPMEFKCVRFNPYYLNNTNKFDVIDIEIEGTKPGRVEVAFLPTPPPLLHPRPPRLPVFFGGRGYEYLSIKAAFLFDNGLINHIHPVGGTNQHNIIPVMDIIDLPYEDLRECLVRKSGRFTPEITRAPLIIRTGPWRQPLRIGNVKDAGSLVFGVMEGLLKLVGLAEHLLP